MTRSSRSVALCADEQRGRGREPERLGYDSVWAAEAYGSDAATVLAWLAGQTENIHLGSAIFQIPGRSPAMTAMTAATLDQISAGRFRLGLGPSGPQVSEGWHGVRFGRQLQRTPGYVGVVRKALARDRVGALSVGGRGWRERNFTNQLGQRYGSEDAAHGVRDLYLDGKKDEAAAAPPAELIDAVSLAGPPDVVRDRLAVYRDAGVGTLQISPMAFDFEGRRAQLRQVAELAAA